MSKSFTANEVATMMRRLALEIAELTPPSDLMPSLENPEVRGVVDAMQVHTANLVKRDADALERLLGVNDGMDPSSG